MYISRFISCTVSHYVIFKCNHQGNLMEGKLGCKLAFLPETKHINFTGIIFNNPAMHPRKLKAKNKSKIEILITNKCTP